MKLPLGPDGLIRLRFDFPPSEELGERLQLLFKQELEARPDPCL